MNENFIKFLEEIKSMNITGKELYQQYYLCKNAVRVLEEHASELNQLILDEMNELGVEKQEFDFGKFTKASRTKWEYSPQVFQAEKNVKELKNKEQEEGIATKIETNYLLIK